MPTHAALGEVARGRAEQLDRLRRGCAPASGSIVFSSKKLHSAGLHDRLVVAPAPGPRPGSADSAITGLTLPGMIELPGWTSGSCSSPRPVRGPEASRRTSLAILSRLTATVRSAPDAASDRVERGLGLEVVVGLAQRDTGTLLRASGRRARANSGCVLMPVPTAVPPSATSDSSSRGPARRAPGRARICAGVAAEHLAQADRRRVLQVRAPGLDHVPELVGLALERGAQRRDAGIEALARSRAAPPRCIAVGITSFDDWPRLTWSFGCTRSRAPRPPPSSSAARFAMTSLAFMFDEVPEPVWNTSTTNSSSSRPSATSRAARSIASASVGSSSPSSRLTPRRGPLDPARARGSCARGIAQPADREVQHRALRRRAVVRVGRNLHRRPSSRARSASASIPCAQHIARVRPAASGISRDSLSACRRQYGASNRNSLRVTVAAPYCRLRGFMAGDTPQRLSCFKAYDVRGRVPDELNERAGRGASAARYAQFLGARRVVVGHDIRLSSPELAARRRRRASSRRASTCATSAAAAPSRSTSRRSTSGLDGGSWSRRATIPRTTTASSSCASRRGRSAPTRVCGEIERRIARARTSGRRRGGGRSPARPTCARRTSAISSATSTRAACGRSRSSSTRATAGPASVIDLLEPHLPFRLRQALHEPDGTFPNGVPNPLLPENRQVDGRRGACASGADLGDRLGRRLRPLLPVRRDGRVHRGLLHRRAARPRRRSRVTRARDRATIPRLTWNTLEIVRAAGGRPGAVQERPRVHEGGHAPRGRRLRRRDVGAPLLPRVLLLRQRDDPVAARARADVRERAGP